MRIGDRDRWRTQRRLRASYLRGELSDETFEGRIAGVLAARDIYDLRPLAADLPGLADRLRMRVGRLSRPSGPALIAPRADPGVRLALGRSRACDVRFVEGSVSRDHAELRRVKEGWMVVDHASTNGTFVNGVRVTRAPVSDGDVIGLGGAHVVLRT